MRAQPPAVLREALFCPAPHYICLFPSQWNLVYQNNSLDVGVVYGLDVGVVYGLDVGVVYSLDVGVVYGLDVGVVYSLDAVLAGDCRQSSFLIHHLIASVHAITDYNYTMHHLLFCRYILIILFIFDFQFYILSRFISDLQFHI